MTSESSTHLQTLAAEFARAEGTLSGLEPADWSWLAANATEQAFPAGTAIVEQGGAVAALHVIVAGTVRVEFEDEAGNVVALAELGRGAVLGEMSFVDTSAANVSVVAQDDVATMTIDGQVLAQMVQGNRDFGFRFYRSVANTLSRRLRATTALKQREDKFVWI